MNFSQSLLEQQQQSQLFIGSENDTIPDFERSFLSALDKAFPESENAAYQLQEHSLGSELLLVEPSINVDLFVICSGRVRVLTQPVGDSREVTAFLLEEGDTFGAETYLGVSIPPYRAIAAGPVRLARVSITHLDAFLKQFSDWVNLLRQQAQKRDIGLFFRTCTELRSLSSLQLKTFWHSWSEQRVSAGSFLTEATSPEQGRFWLRRGEIKSHSADLPPPAIGDSWGHPYPITEAWQAETDLIVYRLAPDVWDNLKAIQSSHSAIAASHSSAKPTQVGSLMGAPVQDTPVVDQPAPVASNSVNVPVAIAPSRSTASIPFPKPAHRRLKDWFDRYPYVEQQSASDCGAACLSMILRYWGKHLPLYVLRDRANVGRTGASLKSLAKAGEDLGFQTRPVRASFSRMVDQPNPWIAHWESNHYVVVYRCQGDRVIIADPALGKRAISRREFQSRWTGYALLLDPTSALDRVEASQTSFGRYLGTLIPYRNVVFQVILVSLLIQVFGLITPLFTQIILDRVIVQKSQTTLNVFVLGLLLFGVWGIGMAAVRQYLLSYFSNRLDLTLVSGFIRYALALPLKFFESRRVGDILTRVQENQKIQQFLVGQIVLAWLNVMTGFVYLGLMLYYNWRLTLLVLGLIPPIVLLTLGATPLLRKVSREIFNEAAEQNSALVEMVTGVATVKAVAAEQDLRWRWEDHLTRQMNAIFRGQKLGIGLQLTSGLIHSVGSTLLLWYGATLVIQGQLTIGQFVAFNMMIGYVINPVVELANLWDELQEVLISVERLNDVFEAKPEEASGQALLKLPQLQGMVQFENVTFRYSEDEERNTLQNISFEAYPGQTIAIVGRSGSGKSTLAKLMQGLYFPNNGRVFVDGHDVRHVSLQSLRSQIGVVPQECFLFSGTILENITLYRSEFSLEQVIEVAKLAEAHSFVQSLPLGYSTVVGERGSTLSGGQRQRIAIARALLGNPRILILDEATSSLDTESERRFQRNLVQISGDRTTFIIAHRLSTVRHADTILVLDRGVLVEHGNHEALMAQQGLYYHLAQQQLDL